MSANPSPSTETAVTRKGSVSEPESHALLRDVRRFLKAIVVLLQTLPPRLRTLHLAGIATALIARIDAATPNTETED